MKISNLALVPKAIDQVADWYYDEWGHFNPQFSSAHISESLKKYLQDESLPQALVAMESHNPIGVAEIKFHELSLYPQYEHWLGGVYVIPEYRGNGIGSELIQHALKLAESHGVSQMYLQTLRLDGGIYSGLGWTAVEEFKHKGHAKLLMTYRFCS